MRSDPLIFFQFLRSKHKRVTMPIFLGEIRGKTNFRGFFGDADKNWAEKGQKRTKKAKEAVLGTS